MAESHTCPVCGYPGLYERPWSGESASDEICPSCGTHFGYDDWAEGDPGARPMAHAELRAKWLQAGRPWFSSGRSKPADWPPPSADAPGE